MIMRGCKSIGALCLKDTCNILRVLPDAQRSKAKIESSVLLIQKDIFAIDQSSAL